MNFLKVRRYSYHFFGIVFAFLSLPAVSAQSSSTKALFSFAEFNIAFVLGLSLPILLFTLFMKSVVSIRWELLVLITLATLGLLYSFAYVEHDQNVISLTFATLFLALLSVWPLISGNKSNSVTVEKNKTLTKASLSLIVTGTLVYIFMLWVLPKVDAYRAWSIFSFLVLTVSAVRLWFFSKEQHNSTMRISLQWLLSLLFSGAIYLWLDLELALSVLVIVTVLSYLIALINGCWLLGQRILAGVPTDSDKEKISSEELFAYTHDPATNLPTIQQALKQFERRLKSTKSQKLAAIVFKPINFQQVNTLLGHHNSDILLLQLAYCIQQKVADNTSLLCFDTSPEPVRLARLQSLHFLIVLDLNASEHDEKSVISNLCQQLANAVPEAMSFKSFSLNFELAFGVAYTGEHGNNVAEVVSRAGDALLEAETQHQLLCYFDNSTLMHTEKQLSRMESLRKDIIADKLHWFLQPQMNVNDKSITGFELKVHWYVGDDQPLELADFIDTANHSGEVYLLTKQMFDQAYKALAILHSIGVYQQVSVNLSSTDLLEPDLIDYIEQHIRSSNISGKYLIIELTEQVMIEACERAKSIIDQLKSLDVSIAIANFSGSYESLRYLRKMAVHQVKIDCEHLSSSEDTHADKAIINALITLTRSMNIPLVGSNIVKHETVKAFKEMGGTLVQGHIVNQGVALEEIEPWMKMWNAQYQKS